MPSDVIDTYRNSINVALMSWERLFAHSFSNIP